MSDYLEKVATDFNAIGLATREPEYPDNGYDQISTLMGATLKIGRYAIREDRRPAVGTEVGQRVLDLFFEDVPFRRTREYNCCSEAEWRLLDIIDPDTLADPALASPVLVTYEDEVCGVIKWQEERTCYGLRDIPAANLYAGAFHALPPDTALPLGGPPADHAWTMPLESIGSFDPLRVSSLIVPAVERAALVSDVCREEEVMVLTAPDDIVSTYAAMALESAQPIQSVRLPY